MRYGNLSTFVLLVLISTWALPTPGNTRTQEKPKVQIPEAGVPEIMTMEGAYIRAAYNNEGYAILGYRLANESLGKEWMLLEFGVTVREGVPDYTMTRDALSLETPDGKTLPLPSLTEYRKSNEVRALQMRERVQRDSINYFPPGAIHACRIGFFSDVEDRPMPWDEVELSSERACLGRLFFQVPGGIAYGQHWLNVKFQESLIRVPFRILTEDEEKLLSKEFKDIQKQVEEAFKKKS
ncbi:MAG TPA: hypothetical protein VLK65_06505 [Vicinamibacteria bacterium]|nr:hypothetical protein [Vicinamibacteria bacterium]